MLDNLLDGLKDNFAGAVAEKAGVSMDQATSMFPIAKDAVSSGLMEKVSGGGISDILGMFNGGGDAPSGGIMDTIKAQITKGIMTKMGLPESIAGLAAGAGAGNLLGGLGDMLKGDDGQVSESGLMDKLGGGAIGDIAKDMLKDKLGGGIGGAIGGLFGK